MKKLQAFTAKPNSKLSTQERIERLEKALLSTEYDEIREAHGAAADDARAMRKKLAIERQRCDVMTELACYVRTAKAPDVSRLYLYDAITWCIDNESPNFWYSPREVPLDEWLEKILSAYRGAGHGQ